MGAMSRNKGSRGERELARLLSDELGVEVTRNLLQCRDSGHDLDGIPDWCLEVKRRAKVTEGEKRQWWEQANEAALDVASRSDGGFAPAVAYRADRGSWRFIVPLGSICPSEVLDRFGYEWAAEISLPAFCQLVRESLEAA